MQVSKLMTRQVELVAPDATLAELARRMRDEHVGALPVAENDRMIGMVTDRDIVVRGLADGADPAGTTAREVMSARMLYCYEDQEADEVARNMGEMHVRRLAVLNREDRLVGMVSLGDISAMGPADKAGEALHEIALSPPEPA